MIYYCIKKKYYIIFWNLSFVHQYMFFSFFIMHVEKLLIIDHLYFMFVALSLTYE